MCESQLYEFSMNFWISLLQFHGINAFASNAPFLYPPKTSWILRLSFLGGRERVHLEQMGYGRTKWNEYKK